MMVIFLFLVDFHLRTLKFREGELLAQEHRASKKGDSHPYLLNFKPKLATLY